MDAINRAHLRVQLARAESTVRNLERGIEHHRAQIIELERNGEEASDPKVGLRYAEEFLQVFLKRRDEIRAQLAREN